ncbi:hypothetical protein TMEN_6890 [Trichophyton mentagrophytes]|nr:hypothetical protein TMEN_6890 [Trichophyton mentagrophytes]
MEMEMMGQGTPLPWAVRRWAGRVSASFRAAEEEAEKELTNCD